MAAKDRAKELGVKGLSELALFVLIGVFTLLLPTIIGILWLVLAGGVWFGTWETTKAKLGLLFAKEQAKQDAQKEVIELKDPNAK